MFRRRFPVTTLKHHFFSPASLFAVLLILLLAACGGGTQQTSSTTPTTTGSQSQFSDFGLAALQGYQVSLFARLPPNTTGPDPLVIDNGFVYIDYQNTTAKDCTDKNTSTVVQYDMNGKMLKTFTVPGHSDGMRADPSSHLLWVTSCEDGNPKFVTIDP